MPLYKRCVQNIIPIILIKKALATPEKIKSIDKITIVRFESIQDSKLHIFYMVLTAPEIIRCMSYTTFFT